MTVLSRSHRTPGIAWWLCQCECGEHATVRNWNLSYGTTQSCGCLQRELASKSLSSRRGEDALRWSAGAVGYNGHHNRVRAARGAAGYYLCVDCQDVAHQWSYVGECDEETRDQSSPYCPHIDCYVPRCRSCHTRYDRRVA